MPKDKLLRIILLISFSISLIVPAINYRFIYPSFTKLIIENTEDEAERTARHLETSLTENMQQLNRKVLPEDLSANVDQAKNDFRFTKLKLFSREGEIIYSTDSKDIGELNTNDYFHRIVAKGEKYTKVVKKDTKSLEGKIVKTDVVETYVPIIKQGLFVGAFEIYYDITGRFDKLNSTILYFSLLPLVMMLVFFALITITILRLDKTIRDQKRAEKEVIMYAEKLKMRNNDLEEFAYVASHDLQEPLRKITAFGDRLKSQYNDLLDEKGRDYLQRMQSAAKRMQNLIQGLLTFSRITTKAQPFVPVDLSFITKEVLSDLEVRIQETSGRVEVNNLPTVEADPLQMRQLFQNLIGNALKFSKSGEPPVVKVSGGYIQGNNSPDGKLYRITVEDNGIGFENKYAERIFGMFQRLHGRQEYEGTGIGLSVCKKIVERHGGNITAHSAPGNGAKFIITLPLKHEGAGTESVSRAE